MLFIHITLWTPPSFLELHKHSISSLCKELNLVYSYICQTQDVTQFRRINLLSTS